MKENRLVRKQSDRMVLGVCAGLADYVNVDPVIVRLIFVLLTLGHGSGLLAYLILALIMPEEGEAAATANPFDEEEIIIKEA